MPLSDPFCLDVLVLKHAKHVSITIAQLIASHKLITNKSGTTYVTLINTSHQRMTKQTGQFASEYNKAGL